MKKTLLIVALALLTSLTASAQFQKGKGYVGASLTGLNMSYNGGDGFNFGIEAKGGYLLAATISSRTAFILVSMPSCSMPITTTTT